MYRVVFLPEARKDALILYKSEPQAYKKLEKLIQELEDHPETGTGHPKPLGGDKVGQWSRRITDKHRLIYAITEEQVAVLILSARGHYSDK
jgi:toxin YoeB